MRVITLDFETEAIKPRPEYPPKPVGLAVKYDGKPGRYYAWGHPTQNNATRPEVQRLLRSVFADQKLSLIFQNAKFDLDVACEHFGVRMPKWDRVHDTMFLLFLHDPHAKSLSLKPAAEAILGWPPDEQEAVRDWLVAQRIVRKGEKGWGAHIAKAPGDLVGRYAIGDVDRTYALFKKLHPTILKRGMGAAYDRERQLQPVLLRNEQRGVRVNRVALERDVGRYGEEKKQAEFWLRKRLKAPGLNLDADADVAKALKKAGVVENFALTATGRESVSKRNLTAERFTDAKVFGVLGYRNALQTLLGTFMETWLALSAHDGRIHTSWNQVRQTHGADAFAGARTGRMSSSPSLLNIPKEFPAAIQPKGFAPLPLMRRYALPNEGGVWGRRDYNQQEFRILAHYEDDALKAAYLRDPRTDVHAWLQDALKRAAGLELPRKDVKVVNFSDIYGMGLGSMAEKLKVDVATVQAIRAAKRSLMPGLATLQKEIKARVAQQAPIRTWGGREYFVEPAKWNGERWINFDYKLLNYLIQGSAADCTKEAIIRLDDAGLDCEFLVTVHDELNVSLTRGREKKEMKQVREVMQSIEFDVPMLSDGEVGPSWGELEKEAV